MFKWVKIWIWNWGNKMVDIDFHRLIDSAKDELSLAKALFMPENKRHEYYQERRDRTEKRFYEEGGPHNSNRQLYMAKMITTPLIENGLMPQLQKTVELGAGYQPNLSVPLVFLPQYNDHIDLYYKGYKLFDLEMRDVNGQQHTPSGIKSVSIASQEAKQILAKIPNDEWNDVVSKVVPELLSDAKLDEMSLMMTKTDTDYLQRLNSYLQLKNIQSENRVSLENMYPSTSKPDAQTQVSSISDEDLERMYESMLQGQMSESDVVDHQYGG